MDGWRKLDRKAPKKKSCLRISPLFKRIFLGLHQSPKIMTTGTKEFFFVWYFSHQQKEEAIFFLFGISPPTKTKTPSHFMPSYAFVSFCQKTLPFLKIFFPVQIFLPLLQIYANQIFASILKPAFLITAAGVGMTLIALKILSKHPGSWFWAKPKHLKRKTLIDMEGIERNCGEIGVWGGGWGIWYLEMSFVLCQKFCK